MGDDVVIGGDVEFGCVVFVGVEGVCGGIDYVLFWFCDCFVVEVVGV